MSLIEEALRRVQDPVVANAPWPTASPQSPTKPPSAIRPTSPKANLQRALPRSFTLVALTVLILSIGFVLGAVIWGKRILVQRPAAKPQAFPASSTFPDAAEKLVVTGVAEGRGEPYAVINGAIVTVGEHIQDFTLLEITDGAVRLRGPDGKDVTLRVRR